MPTLKECLEAQAIVDAYQKPIFNAAEQYFWWAEGDAYPEDINIEVYDDENPMRISVTAKNHISGRYMIIDPPMTDVSEVVKWIDNQTEMLMAAQHQKEFEAATKKKIAQDKIDRELFDKLTDTHPEWF